MVEAVAAVPARPLPAQLAHLATVQRTERVSEAKRFEPPDQRQLGLVPPLATLFAKLPVAIARERPNVTVRVLPARRVEVTAHQPRPGSLREVRVDRFMRADLRKVRRGTDRRMEVDHLEPLD